MRIDVVWEFWLWLVAGFYGAETFCNKGGQSGESEVSRIDVVSEFWLRPATEFFFMGRKRFFNDMGMTILMRTSRMCHVGDMANEMAVCNRASENSEWSDVPQGFEIWCVGGLCCLRFSTRKGDVVEIPKSRRIGSSGWDLKRGLIGRCPHIAGIEIYGKGRSSEDSKALKKGCRSGGSFDRFAVLLMLPMCRLRAWLETGYYSLEISFVGVVYVFSKTSKIPTKPLKKNPCYFSAEWKEKTRCGDILISKTSGKKIDVDIVMTSMLMPPPTYDYEDSMNAFDVVRGDR